MGTGRPLMDATGKLAQGNDNGIGIYKGSWDGVFTMMFQKRWTLNNCVLLFNQREERPGVTQGELYQPLYDVIEEIGW